MRGEVAAVVAIVAVLIGAGAGYLVGNANERTITTTSVSTTSLVKTVTSTYFDLGALLQLQVSLNASAIRAGGDVSAVIAMVNPLDVNLTAIPPVNRSAIFESWDWADFVCGENMLWDTASFALFTGRVTAANLSSAGTPLTLAPPVYPPPPCVTFASPSMLVFEPMGSEAWAYLSSEIGTLVDVSTHASTGVCQTLSTGATSCGGSGGLNGYWNVSATVFCGNSPGISSSCFHYFSPGWYTLVVEAAWGQSAFESFQVTS